MVWKFPILVFERLLRKCRKQWQQILHLGLFFSVSFLVLRPVIPSAFSADDTFDSFTPFQLRYSGMSPVTFISDVTGSWMRNQGRFFPSAVAIGTFSHYFFPGRLGYKVLQLSVALTALLMFYLFIRILVKSHAIAVLSSLFSLCAMQFKVQYDPILQFSLQQPFLVVLLCCSFLTFVLSIRGENSYLYICSCFFFLWALLTYETAVLLWPVFLFILVIEKSQRWKTKLIGTMAAPFAVVIHLMYLRSQVEVTSAGYTSNFEIGAVGRTFFKQLVASIPMSFAEINSPPYLLQFPQNVQSSDALLWLATCIAFGLVMWIGKSIPSQSFRIRASLIGIGLTLWAMPAIVVAQTVRWQDEIVFGNGYITAYQGYFGFALVLMGIFLQIKAVLRNRSRTLSGSLLVGTAILVCLSVSSLVANNSRAVAQYNPGYLWPREHFERAIETGTFDLVESGTSLFSTQPEWWFNAPLINWFGGPRVDDVINPRNAQKFQDCLNKLILCKKQQSLDYAFNTFGIFPNDTRATVVGYLERFTEVEGSLGGILINKVSIFVEYPTRSSSVNDSDNRCRTWLSSRLETQGLQISPSQVIIQRVTVSSCNAILPSNLELNLLKFNP